MALILGLFFIGLTVWFVWALVVGTRKRNQANSPACPQCGGFKLPRAPLCFDCTIAERPTDPPNISAPEARKPR